MQRHWRKKRTLRPMCEPVLALRRCTWPLDVARVQGRQARLDRLMNGRRTLRSRRGAEGLFFIPMWQVKSCERPSEVSLAYYTYVASQKLKPATMQAEFKSI